MTGIEPHAQLIECKRFSFIRNLTLPGMQRFADLTCKHLHHMIELSDEREDYDILWHMTSMLCCRWNPAYGVAGASNLYIQLMDALFDINQDMLFLIQGPGQVNLTGVGGSSYVTNIPNAFIADNRDSDPNSFFKQVLVKPYISQVGRTRLPASNEY